MRRHWRNALHQNNDAAIVRVYVFTGRIFVQYLVESAQLAYLVRLSAAGGQIFVQHPRLVVTPLKDESAPSQATDVQSICGQSPIARVSAEMDLRRSTDLCPLRQKDTTKRPSKTLNESFVSYK